MEFENVLAEVVQAMGLQALKPKQKETVMTFLAHNDVFVSLPTGYGKSIIYAVLPGIFDRLKGNKSFNTDCMMHKATSQCFYYRIYWKYSRLHKPINDNND